MNNDIIDITPPGGQPPPPADHLAGAALPPEIYASPLGSPLGATYTRPDGQNVIHYAVVLNPFKPRQSRRDGTLDLDSTSLEELARIADLPVDVRFMAAINGTLISAPDWERITVTRRDWVIFTPWVGDDGKAWMRIVLMAVLIIVAWWASPALIAAYGATTASFMVGAGLMIGGLLINMLLPSPKPELDDVKQGTSRSWSPHNTASAGVFLPRIYGRFRRFGNVIGCWTRSKGDDQILNLLMEMAQGPIAAISNIRINDQPRGHFKRVKVFTRLGQLRQPVIKNFKITKNEYQLSLLVDYGTPRIYTTLKDDFDGIEVDIQFPNGLWHVNKKGKLEQIYVDVAVGYRKQGTSTWTYMTRGSETMVRQTASAGHWSRGHYQIDSEGLIGSVDHVWIQVASGSTDPEDEAYYEGMPGDDNTIWHYLEQGDPYSVTGARRTYKRVHGKKTTPIRRSFRVWIEDGSEGYYEIGVWRNTQKYRPVKQYGDELYISNVRLLYNEKFRRPKKALLSIEAVTTDQLSGSLRCSALVKGSIVNVYNGTTWNLQWSDNPAWCLYDVLTQPCIGGLGTTEHPYTILRHDGFQPSEMDLPKFQELATFCNQQVSDGAGGYEKRFRLNACFDYEASAWDVANAIGLSCRCTPFLVGDKVTLFIDKEREPVNAYNVTAMLAKGEFKRSYLPVEDRATEVEVQFFNEAKDYQRDSIVVCDSTKTSTYRRATREVIGLTKQSEAWRVGMYHLMCNRYLLRTYSGQLDLETLNATLGDTLYLQHDLPRMADGGFILAGTATSITLDRPVTIAAGQSYTCLIKYAADDSWVLRDPTNAVGEHTVLTFAGGALPSAPQKWDRWTFGTVAEVEKPVTVANMRRKPKDLTADVEFMEYNPSIYAFEDAVPQWSDSTEVRLRQMQPAVQSITHSAILDLTGRRVPVVNITIVNTSDVLFDHYEVWYHPGNTFDLLSIQYSGIVTGTDYQLNDVRLGQVYRVYFVPVNTGGKRLRLSESRGHRIKVPELLSTADMGLVGGLDMPAGLPPASGVFFEGFDGDVGFWELRTGDDDYATYPEQGQSGGRVYDTGGKYLWKSCPTMVPFVSTKLYRMKALLRKVSGTGNSLAYVGVEGVAADGVTLVNANGNNDFYSQHYICASSANLAPVGPTGAWTEFVGYFKGWAATGSTSSSTDPGAPVHLHANVRYMRPMMILGYSTDGDVWQIDHVTIDIMAETADVIPYGSGHTVGDLEPAEPGATEGGTIGTNIKDPNGVLLHDHEVITSLFRTAEPPNPRVVISGTRIAVYSDLTTQTVTIDQTGLHAVAGDIGGFTLGATAQYAGAGATRIQLDTATGIHLGATAFADAPLSMSLAGAIKATSGVVGGFTLSATAQYAGAGATRIQLDTAAGIHLGATAFADAPLSMTLAGAIKATSGTVGGCLLAATSIGSTTFVSGPLGSGWRVNNDGSAEFQNATIRGIIRTSVFEKDTISAVNGYFLVTKSDVLAVDMTAADASTITIKGETTFVANEVIRIKDGADDEWMLVTNAASAPTYTVTRDLVGSYGADANPVWKKGTAVASLGVGTGTKTGFISFDASSANSPFIDVYGRNSNTWDDYTLHARLGWLKGIVDTTVGLNSTDVWGLYSDSVYLKGVLSCASGEVVLNTSGIGIKSASSYLTQNALSWKNGSGADEAYVTNIVSGGYGSMFIYANHTGAAPVAARNGQLVAWSHAADTYYAIAALGAQSGPNVSAFQVYSDSNNDAGCYASITVKDVGRMNITHGGSPYFTDYLGNIVYLQRGAAITDTTGTLANACTRIDYILAYLRYVGMIST